MKRAKIVVVFVVFSILFLAMAGNSQAEAVVKIHLGETVLIPAGSSSVPIRYAGSIEGKAVIEGDGCSVFKTLW